MHARAQITALLAAALLVVAHDADAQRIGLRCRIASVTSLNFGGYDSESAMPLTSTAVLRVSCPRIVSRQITVTVGPSSVTGSINDRRLRRLGGSDELRYNVYQDQRGTRVWGDGTTGGSPLVTTVRGDETIELYGIVDAGQDAAEGVYGDALRITVMP